MKTLAALLPALLAASPSAAQECNRFKDLWSEMEIVLSDDGEGFTTYYRGKDPVQYQMRGCGTGLVALCGWSEEADPIHFVRVHGTIEDGAEPQDILIVNGVSAFFPACD